MVSCTKKQKFATKVGAALVMMGLLLAFGTVAAVNMAYDDAFTAAGSGASSSEVLWSAESAADIDTPQLLQQGCGPILTDPFPVAFDANATVGSGLALNTSTPEPIRVCAPLVDNSAQLVIHTKLLGSEIAALGGQFIEFGWTTDDPQSPNRTLDLRFGAVSPAVPDDISPIVCGACALDVVVTEGQPNRFALSADIVAFFEIFPTFELAFRLGGDHTKFPAYLTEWVLDISIYGESAQANATVDLFGAFTVDEVLGAMYYSTAFLGVMGSALLWPSTTFGSFKKGGKR